MKTGALKWVRDTRRALGKFRARNRHFYNTFPLPKALERAIVDIDDEDPEDRNGVCPFQKKWALASIIAGNKITRSVEIGVYRGSSFLPTAAAMRYSGGVAYGIDPYDASIWDQDQQESSMIWALGENWREERLELDWGGFYNEVAGKLKKFDLENSSQIIVGLSHEVSEEIDFEIGLLHIDGNHDFDAVEKDVQLYFPKLAPRAFVVFDDTNWEGVAPHYSEAKKQMNVVWETTGYGILQRD